MNPDLGFKYPFLIRLFILHLSYSIQDIKAKVSSSQAMKARGYGCKIHKFATTALGTF